MIHVFINPLRGKTSLAKVFWYSFGANAVFSLFGSVVEPHTRVALTVYYLAGLAIGVIESAMLWQCAPNSRYSILEMIIRGGVFVSLLLVPVFVYLIITQPQLLAAP